MWEEEAQCAIRLGIKELHDQKFRIWVLAKNDKDERHCETNWPRGFELGIVNSYLTNLIYFFFLSN